MNKRILRVSTLLLFIILASCTTKKMVPLKTPQIADVINFPQNPFIYADSVRQGKDDIYLVDAEVQKTINRLSNQRYFKVWTDDASQQTRNAQNTLNYYKNLLNNYFKNPGIGENKLYRDSVFVTELIKTANIDNGFNTMKKGIIVEPSNIRVVPSNKPFFRDFALAGEGYPFDYWQNSTIPAATPVFIYHETEHWVLIDSHICSGWIPKSKVAYISESLIERFINLPQLVIVKDNQAITNRNAKYLGRADIGTIFPLISEQFYSYTALFVEKDNQANAQPVEITVNKEIASEKPIRLTVNNVAKISSEMINQNYGWGGMYYNRDCSQAMLDLFICFGILLPRNSRQQANNGGTVISIKDIKPNEKKQFIINNATPFSTLIGMPGHIMLYLGHYNKEPIVFHNMWGVRTLQGKQEGRFIVGKAVITTLEPGKEVRYFDKDRNVLNRIETLTFLVP